MRGDQGGKSTAIGVQPLPVLRYNQRVGDYGMSLPRMRDDPKRPRLRPNAFPEFGHGGQEHGLIEFTAQTISAPGKANFDQDVIEFGPVVRRIGLCERNCSWNLTWFKAEIPEPAARIFSFVIDLDTH